MTTTSFTLRKSSVGGGSYLQNGGDDAALRSDGFISFGTPVVADNTFSANIINASTVELSWELSFTIVSSGASTAPIGLAIVASSTGEPVTVKDGTLVTTVTSNDVTSFDDIVRVPQGRWVYYSLFIKYSDFQTTPTTWYERAATLYIQIPKQYNSVENLWNRIPEYYRNLDVDQPGNPLYNFIELFGWELDRTRTLIDSVALSNDPDLAVTPALAQLAYETGLEINPDILGTTKTRALLQNIGYLRRRKGTIESITAYLSALTGCQIDFPANTSGASFKVHTQRINFVPDSSFYDALGTATAGTSPDRTRSQNSTTYGVYSYAPSTAAAASFTSDGSKLTVSVPSGTGNTTVVVYTKQAVPYYKPAYYYTSFNATLSSASFSNFRLTDYQSGGTPVWESATPGTPPTNPYYDTWNTTAQPMDTDSAKLVSGTITSATGRFQLTPNSDTETTVNVLPSLVFTIAPGGSITLSKWMVEPYSLGEYFDGNSREGGLIPTVSGYGTGTYDYRWASTAKASFSYYTLDYKRVYSVVDNIIKNYIAPVTVKDSISITWDYYPGK